VIGLGTNGTPTVDPRQDLEALAKLTGAINRSATTIPNGTATPIAPGDPLYFQIASGFGASVANGITTAIENAVSAVSVDLTLKASDPTVHIESAPQVINNVSAGQTATFDVTFQGDGRPHRFDLQFVRQGTSVVLGSIPVVIGTPITGDGYEYVELEDGEIQHAEDFGDSYNASLPTNVAPTFTAGSDQGALEGSGHHSIHGWASSVSAGPASDSGQVVDFVVNNDNPSLFTEAPAISPDGTLTYTPAPGATGSATVTVSLRDSGGTVGGGVDTSGPATFAININPALAISGGFEFDQQQVIALDFNQDVNATLQLSDVHVIDLASGLPIAPSALAYDATSHHSSLSFGSVLPDGNYRVTIAPGDLPNMAAPYQMSFFVMTGDANHDGKVNADDYFQIDVGYARRGKGFSQGDFNYDGRVDSDDYFAIDNSYAEYTLAGGSLPGAVAASATPLALPPRTTFSAQPIQSAYDRLTAADSPLI
jgi:hypothetical protein